jgi:hypothetical protein
MNTMRLGFCPTMAPYAARFDTAIEEIDLVPLGSAGQAMSLLRTGAIDIALIGREAYKRELSGNVGRRRLMGGYTLVYPQKVAIAKEQLAEIPVKTYLPAEVVQQLLPTLENVIFFPTFEECASADAEIPMLIDWKDFRDEHEMLIPVEANGAKVPAFRAPVVFYNKESVSEDFVDRLAEVVQA